MFRVSARTVLELGSELISSDIIAFYELIKNAFDAGSTSGAEIRFQIVLRRNTYLRLRAQAASALASEDRSAKQSAELTSDLAAEISNSLDRSARPTVVAGFLADIATPRDVSDLIEKLDIAYRNWNTVEISDTGSGMSMEDLSNNYLVIGTPSRKRVVDEAIEGGQAKSPFLGEKGIGRLSAMRLGERLLVESARIEDPRLSILDIDWRQFANVDAMLEDIKIQPRQGERKPDVSWSGTRLTISDLREDWTEVRVRSLAEYDFARVIDPFLGAKNRPRIALFWNGARIAIPFMDRELIRNAHASVDGTYAVQNGEPVLKCTLEARDLGFPHPLERDSVTLTAPELHGALIGPGADIPETALASVGTFTFEAHWYNRRRLGQIDSIGDQRTVRELQRKWSGILLFRDGFRVFPYGEDDDDWLGLDRKALGSRGYTLNKTQFVGRVNITRTGNSQLVDQTNREGLRVNPEQEVFVNLLQQVIQGLLWTFLRDVERRYKSQPIDLGDLKSEVTALESRAKYALSRIRRVIPKDQAEIVNEIQQAFQEFQDLAARAQNRIVEIEAESRQMVDMAGVGLMVEVVAHELARASENALQALEGLRSNDVPADVRVKLDTLRAEMKSVSRRLRVLDPLSVSGRQRSEVFDLAELIEDLRSGHAAKCQRHNIQFHVEKPVGSLRLRAVKGLVVQVVENLIANSMYWMRLRATRERAYEPNITIRLEKDPITLYFTDNGIGIAPENREKIFRPFWSLKEKAYRRGLGLYIARENATYLGARLALSDHTDPVTNRHHEFVLAFPESASVQ